MPSSLYYHGLELCFSHSIDNLLFKYLVKHEKLLEINKYHFIK